MSERILELQSSGGGEALGEALRALGASGENLAEPRSCDNNSQESKSKTLDVARFAGSTDLNLACSQGSQSLALGLAKTAASQLDDLVRSPPWLLAKAAVSVKSILNPTSAQPSSQ